MDLLCTKRLTLSTFAYPWAILFITFQEMQNPLSDTFIRAQTLSHKIYGDIMIMNGNHSDAAHKKSTPKEIVELLSIVMVWF